MFNNWTKGEFRLTNLHGYGQDFGFKNDHTTLVHCSVDLEKNTIYLKEVYGAPNLTTSDIAYRNKINAGSELIVADNSEPRLIKELKSYWVNIREAKKFKGSILTGIALMQNFKIVVDKNSKNLIRDFSNYAWHEKNRNPVDKFNDYIDAARYIIEYLLKNRRAGEYHIL